MAKITLKSASDWIKTTFASATNGFAESGKKAAAAAKLNFVNLKAAYFAPLALFLLILAVSTLNVIIGAEFLSELLLLYANLCALLLLIIAVFLINFRNNHKIMRLNAKRKDVFWAFAINYAVLVAFASALIVALYYISVPLRQNGRLGEEHIVMKYLDVYALLGFNQYGLIVGFLQLFSLLLLAVSVVHVMVAMQQHWSGQVVLGIVCLTAVWAVLGGFDSVSEDIAVFIKWLNPAWGIVLVDIFEQRSLGNASTALEIILALFLAACAYATYLPVLKRTNI